MKSSEERIDWQKHTNNTETFIWKSFNEESLQEALTCWFSTFGVNLMNTQVFDTVKAEKHLTI